MKGYYLLAFDIPRLDEITAKYDTLIINGFGYDEPGPRFLTHDQIVNVCDTYRPRGITVILSLIWQRPGFVGYQERVENLLRFSDMGIFDGVIYDVEGYRRDEYGNPWNDDELTDEWRAQADYMRQSLSRVSFTGQMPYKALPGLMCWPNGFTLFLECTYTGFNAWDTIKLFARRFYYGLRYGLTYKLVPGLWRELFTPEEWERQTRLMTMIYGGYWVYSDPPAKQ